MVDKEYVSIVTTDERYVKVDEGRWWDTTGIDVVDEAEVDAYMAANPRVGVMVRRSRE